MHLLIVTILLCMIVLIRSSTSLGIAWVNRSVQDILRPGRLELFYYLCKLPACTCNTHTLFLSSSRSSYLLARTLLLCSHALILFPGTHSSVVTSVLNHCMHTTHLLLVNGIDTRHLLIAMHTTVLAFRRNMQR